MNELIKRVFVCVAWLHRGRTRPEGLVSVLLRPAALWLMGNGTGPGTSSTPGRHKCTSEPEEPEPWARVRPSWQTQICSGSDETRSNSTSQDQKNHLQQSCKVADHGSATIATATGIPKDFRYHGNTAADLWGKPSGHFFSVCAAQVSWCCQGDNLTRTDRLWLKAHVSRGFMYLLKMKNKSSVAQRTGNRPSHGKPLQVKLNDTFTFI